MELTKLREIQIVASTIKEIMTADLKASQMIYDEIKKECNINSMMFLKGKISMCEQNLDTFKILEKELGNEDDREEARL